MQAISEGEKAADIQALTSQVQELAQKHGFWNTWSVRLIAFSIVATVLYFFAQWMTNGRGNELSEAQAILIRAKDDQLALDLKDKESQIAFVKKDTAKATEETARLTKEAETAKTERAEADKQIAIAKADAARAKEGIANAEAVSAKAGVEVARLQVVVSNAEKMRLEAERALLELQDRIKPRRLTARQSADFVKILRGLPDGTIDFGYTSGGGDEAFNHARQLLALFKEAGWTVRNEASIANHLEISVTGIGILMRGPAAPDPSKPPPPAAIILTPTLAALQSAFKAIGTNVQFINMGPGRDEKIVEVVIGSKPEP